MPSTRTPRSAYLSSTLNDLQDERQAVRNALSGRYAVVESYEPDPQDLSQSCIGDVAACALYIGIVGLRYGFVPPGQSKSITKLEFEAALAAGLPCYVFVKDADAIPASLSDAYTKENHPALIEAFRARLSSGASGIPRPAQFKNADELGMKLLKALQGDVAEGDADAARDDAPSSAAEAAAGVAVQAGPAKSELQKLLWTYLHENWASLKAQQTLTQARLLAGLAAPLNAATVFDYACRAPVADLLVGARRFFIARGRQVWSSSQAAEGIVCSAIVRIALVAAERHLAAPCQAEAPTRHDHDPMLSTDPLVAPIEAATRLGFGLCFSPGKAEPDNVFTLVHPVPEPGVDGEEGAGLTRSELWATIQRRSIGRDLSAGMLRGLILEMEEDLKTPLVVSSEASGRFARSEHRAALQGELKRDFHLHSFFRQPVSADLPPWLKEIEADLHETFDHIFPP